MRVMRLCGLVAVVLSVLGLAFAGSAMGAGDRVVRLEVSAGTQFSSTGVELARGQQATITATGTITYGSQGPAECRQSIGPDGCGAETICPVPPGACGALVGRIGGGEPFTVGPARTVQGPGVLELGINDFSNTFGDNFGSFKVVIRADDDRPRIRGTVRDAEGKGVAGVRVSAGGKRDTTDTSGGYEIVLRKGTFTVSAAGGYCVVGKPGCATSTSVKLPPNKTVDFGPPPEHTLSGTVLEQTCTADTCSRAGLAGVTVRATGGPGGPEETTTAADGTYALTLPQGTWTVTPSLPSRDFHRLPATGDASVEGFASVALARDVDRVDFVTCAAGAPTAGRAQRVLAPSDSVCPKLDVKVLEVFEKGFTQKVGKSFLGGTDVRVGFTRPGRDGEFRRKCVSGCVNLRVRITDAKTRKLVPQALVTVTARVDGTVVVPDAVTGVFCRADGTSQLDNGCTETASMTLDQKRDLDLYYWLPGVVEATNIVLDVQVTAARYDVAETKVTLRAQPNVAFHGKHRLTGTDAFNLNVVAPALWGLGKTDLADYCGLLANAILDLAAPIVPTGLRNAALQAAQALSKAAKSGCSLAEVPALVPKAKAVLGWLMYWRFQEKLGFPGNGLIGAPRGINFVNQILFDFAGFYSAFLDAQKGYVYANFDPGANLGKGDVMELNLFEVSSRGVSGPILSNVTDALYLRLGGTLAGAPIQAPYEQFVKGGYWPGCWLDPKLNRATWWLPIGFNPCKTPDA